MMRNAGVEVGVEWSGVAAVEEGAKLAWNWSLLGRLKGVETVAFIETIYITLPLGRDLQLWLYKRKHE